ncbi:MAG: DNA polymerase III subunit delta [bacterium]|nr:DNA polymerase III subunit delta [bacterium]
MIYIYYGENSFLIQEKLTRIKETYLIKYSSGLNFFKFDLEENCDDLKSALESQSMFSEKKLVFLRGVLSVTEVKFEEVKEIINKNKFLNKSEDIILVLYDMLSSSAPPPHKASGGHGKATEDRLKYLKTLGEVKEFKNLDKPKLIDWCLKKSQEENIKISRADLAFLIDGVGCDTNRVWNELAKLSAYSGGMIQKKDIENLITFDLTASSFKVTEALAQKKAALALEGLEELWQKNEEPIMVLGALVWQFRNMLKLADVTASNAAQVAQKFKLNPWVAQKTLNALKNFSQPELKNIYQNLADADLAIKTGEKDGREALNDFVCGFLNK